jgi:hypothetical protein
MSRRICTLGDIRFVECDGLGTLLVSKTNGSKETLIHTERGYDSQGMPFMLYRCNNCGRQRDNFEELRAHLGKFNELIDPFNYPEGKENPAG